MINRVLLLAFASFLYQSFLLSLPVLIGVISVPLAVGPAVIVYSAFYQKHSEAIISVILVGALVDALTGIPIGFHSCIFLVLWFFMTSVAQFLGRPDFWMILGLVTGTSLFYRMFVVLTQMIFWNTGANWEVFPWLWAPIVDGVLGGLFVWIFQALLGALRMADIHEDSDRLM